MKCVATVSMASILALFSLASVVGCADKSASPDTKTAANATETTTTISANGTATGTSAYPTTDSTVSQPAPVYAPQPLKAVPTGPTTELSPPVPSTAGRSDVAPAPAPSEALTPMDQGGSEADRRVTQKVRQAVVADGALSFTAKNVKIITVDGKVTLRGPVKSDQERSSIEQKAKSTAGVKAVDNQLEINR